MKPSVKEVDGYSHIYTRMGRRRQNELTAAPKLASSLWMHEYGLPSSSPSNSLKAFGGLRGLLHQRHVDSLMSDAEFIRDYADGEHKTEEAGRHIREATLQHALGRISMTERDRILDILAFAVVAQTSPDAQPQVKYDLDSPAAHGGVT